MVFIFAALAVLMAGEASAKLSGSQAFILIKKVPPGETLEKAVEFLGPHTTENTLDEEAGIKVRIWDIKDSKWSLDILHDGKVVRAAKVRWWKQDRGSASIVFAEMTVAGKKDFGKPGKFSKNGDTDESYWEEMSGHWLVLAKRSGDMVTLLSGIRNDEKESLRYGF